MANKHQTYLENHCRLCAKSLGRVRYACINYSSFLSIWGVDPTSDSADIQPTHFCHSCYVTASRFASSLKKTKRTPVDWLPHNSTSCTVCDVHCKGGRPKKKHSTGRPTLLSTHINAVAGDMPQFTLSQLADERYKEDVTCKSCSCAANNPVELLPCKTLLCCNCCTSIAATPSFTCPGCTCRHESISNTFTKPSSLVEKAFNDLRVTCERCNNIVALESVGKECSHHQPLTCMSKQSAVKVVSQMIQESECGTVTMSTGGRVR